MTKPDPLPDPDLLPQFSEQFRDLSAATYDYWAEFGATETYRALLTMFETVQQTQEKADAES